MGLIRAAVGAVGSTLADQWKEAIRCENLDNDTLMVKKTTPTGVISNGSTVIVGPGQCAIIYDNGRILDASAEEGVYKFDTSSTPSLFAGQFGGMFKEMWQRFTYNGATAKEQAVYFFNTKEILNNKFGTSVPVMYKDWGHPLMNARTNSYYAMSVKVRCHGMFTFKICDPFVLMRNLAGTADVYKREDVVDTFKSEIMAAFNNVMNGLGSDKYKVEVLELQNKTDEIRKIMDENVFDQNMRNRGFQIMSFAVESVSLDEESDTKISNYEMGGDQYQQQGVLTGSYGKALESAANNANGAATGMMGIGMMNMASGNMFGGMANTTKEYMKPQQIEENKKVKDTNSVACPNCGKPITGNFCVECGTKKPDQVSEKFCPNCGNKVDENAKFCMECGTQL